MDAITEEEKRLIWNKGRIAYTEEEDPERPGYARRLNPNVWRMDAFGNFIRYDEYGNTDSIYGLGM